MRKNLSKALMVISAISLVIGCGAFLAEFPAHEARAGINAELVGYVAIKGTGLRYRISRLKTPEGWTQLIDIVDVNNRVYLEGGFSTQFVPTVDEPEPDEFMGNAEAADESRW